MNPSSRDGTLCFILTKFRKQQGGEIVSSLHTFLKSIQIIRLVHFLLVTTGKRFDTQNVIQVKALVTGNC